MLKVPLMNASQEEEMFYDQLRNWGQNELAPHALEWDEEEELPAPILSEAEALGLYSLTFKEEQDGLDLSFRTALLVVETLAQYEASLALKIALLNGPVAQCWPSELPVSQATWAHGSVQITEEGASGVLPDVPWTESARWVMVPQVDRLYMIDLQSEGVECKVHRNRLGLRCAEWADLILTGAKTQVFPLSSEDRQKAEARLQLGWAAVALGLGTAGVRLGTLYAQNRVQFNQAITQFQAIQWMIADSQTALDAVRLSMCASADLLEEQAPYEDFLKEIEHLEEDTQRVIKSWTNTIGQYSIFDDSVHNHEFMKISNYIHITSPIRRLIDLLNQITIMELLGFQKSATEKSKTFVNNWIENLEYINASMRSIRKIQMNTELIHKCSTQPYDKNYKGILFDKIQNMDGMYIYMVYMKEMNMMGRVKTYLDLDNYSEHMFKMFLFEDEYKIRKKIQIQFV